MNKGIKVLLLSEYQLAELVFVSFWSSQGHKRDEYTLMLLLSSVTLGWLLTYKTAWGSLKLRSLQGNTFDQAWQWSTSTEA